MTTIPRCQLHRSSLIHHVAEPMSNHFKLPDKKTSPPSIIESSLVTIISGTHVFFHLLVLCIFSPYPRSWINVVFKTTLIETVRTG